MHQHGQSTPGQGPNADPRQAPVRRHSPGAEDRPGRDGRRISLRTLRAAIFITAASLITMTWLDEALDLPLLLLGSPPTPANWAESSMETGYILAAAGILSLVLALTRRTQKEDDQERKRRTILSDIVMDESPIYFQAFNPDGSIISVSGHLLERTGYTLGEVVGKHYLTLFVAPGEQEELGKKIEELLRTGISTGGENHLVAKDGSEILLKWEARAAWKENGEIDFIYGPGFDITQQKELEKALRASEERYLTFIQNLQGIAYQGDLTFSSLFIYGEVEKITGYTTEELVSGAVRMIDRFHPDDLPVISQEIEKVQTISNYSAELVYRIFRKDGQISWVRDFIRNVCDGSGAPVSLQGIVYDITAVKEAEDAVRKSEERYRLLAENVKDVIWATDTDFRFTYVSPSSVRMSGFSAEEVKNEFFGEPYTKESSEKILEYMAQAKALFAEGFIPADKRSITIEAERHTKDGATIWVEITANIMVDGKGKATGIVGVTRDITARRQAEENLRRSEQHYRFLAENATDVIWAADEHFRFTYVSPSAEKMFGFTAEEIMAHPIGTGYAEGSLAEAEAYRDMGLEWFKQGFVPDDQRTRVFEAERFRKDGSTIWVEITTNILIDEQGKPTGLVGVTRDVTERRQTEEALRKSEERYRLLAGNITDVIWSVDRNLQYTYISPSVFKMRGYTAEEAMALPMEKVVAPGSTNLMVELLIRAAGKIARGHTPPDERNMTFEVELVHKDGSTLWTELTASYVFDPEGRPVGVVGVTRDISPRKRSEEALRENEEMYRTIFESTGTAMAIIEEDETFSLVNGEFENLSGYSASEIEGKIAWRRFVAPEDIQRLAGYHAMRKTTPGEAPRNYEFRFTSRHGVTKNVFATSTLFPGTRRVLLSLQDITMSKLSAEELKRSQEHLRNLFKHAQDVRERERTRVAREIHDELGQVLTGLKMDLSFLAKKLPPELSDLVTKTGLMIRFVDMTIQSVKRITMDLRPGLLDHLGLVAAIEWQAEEFQKRTGIRCIISVTPEEIILEPEQSTSVFRILQETLTNVAKYARATEVRITLVEKGGVFEMSVADNGVGITKEQMQNPKSYGLMGIQERAYFSGGTATVDGRKGTGTTVRIVIPIDQTRSIDDTSTYRG